MFSTVFEWLNLAKLGNVVAQIDWKFYQEESMICFKEICVFITEYKKMNVDLFRSFFYTINQSTVGPSFYQVRSEPCMIPSQHAIAWMHDVGQRADDNQKSSSESLLNCHMRNRNWTGSLFEVSIKCEPCKIEINCFNWIVSEIWQII